MTGRAPNTPARLELTWPNKDKFLLVPKDENGRPVWVDWSHPAAREVRVLHHIGHHGQVRAEPERAADNLAIQGDSLDALRGLNNIPEYRSEYRGKVKLVYIDPPFNTGQTFDHYDDWMEHATWLSFMRDRLIEIRDLLAPDGSVWVHLDDAEVHRMRSLMDEVFGAGNFVATVVWQKAYSPRNDVSGFSADQDYILVYSKNTGWRSNRLPRLASRDALYQASDGDPEPWISGDPAAPGASTHQGMIYAVQSPFTGALVYPAKGRHWSSGQETMKAMVEEWGMGYELRDIDDAQKRSAICGLALEDVRAGVQAIMVKGEHESARLLAEARYAEGSWPRLYFTKGGKGGLKVKRYLSGISQTRAPQTLWFHEEVGHNREAKAELKALFPDRIPFSTPKPERLLARVVHIGSNPGDIVVDVFGGSATTAAVAHKMGRRWVTAEVSKSTVNDFVEPRLGMVVDGADGGGISTAVQWAGGGGFRSLTVGPSMYEVLPGDVVVLADWSTNGKFAEAVAAQLGFDFEPGAKPFSGRRGRMRLAVFDGAVGPEEINDLLGYLGERESVTVVAKVVLEGSETALKSASKGSRIRKAPRDLLADGSRRSLRQAIGREPRPPATNAGETR